MIKKYLLSGLVLSLMITFTACKKESMDNLTSPSSTTKTQGNNTPLTGRIGGMTTPADSALSQFGLLGLNNGTLTINSSTNLIANVGYSSGVTSNTNQKIDYFTGTSYVQSNVTSFIYATSTYQPNGGIIQNNATSDALLNNANTAAVARSATYSALIPNISLGDVASNVTINAVSTNTVVQMNSLTYNSNVLTLSGAPGQDAGFIINVSGNFSFAQSEIRLLNVRPERVIFNFANPSSILINKASSIFNGTLLAPLGSVIYHNPATFNGAIIAKNIAVHSDFNLTQKAFDYSLAP